MSARDLPLARIDENAGLPAYGGSAARRCALQPPRPSAAHTHEWDAKGWCVCGERQGRHLIKQARDTASASPVDTQIHLMFQHYIERLHRRQAKPGTLKNFHRTAELWRQSGLDPLTAEDWQIEEWLAGLPVSPRTRRLHLENLSAAYRYAVHRRILPIAPTEAVRLPREPDKEPRILTQEELRHMIASAPTNEHLLMLASFMFTGMRRSEVRFMKWEDISATSIRVIGKGGKLRHVPLHPALGELIVRQTPRSEYVFPSPQRKKKGQPKTETAFFYMLEKARGNVRCSFHDFRRTVATSLTENGVQEGIIDRIMGWAPRTVGRRYYIRRADESMQEGILRLYSDDPVRLL